MLNDIRKFVTRKRPATYTVVITDTGRKKLEKPGTPEYQWTVLNYLAENGPSTPRDISDDLHLKKERVITICKDLANEGYLIKRSAGSE